MNEKRFDKIVNDIKRVKIQGAENIAKWALKAYFLNPSENTIRKLSSLRPTEPLMFNVLQKAKRESYKRIISELDNFQEKINQNVFRMIENGDVFFTHCHSTTVINALINAKKKGKRFRVCATETRPLDQGRKTTSDLVRNGIPTEMIVDSASMIVLSGGQGMKKPTKVLIGADALTKEGIINKVGSGMIAKIASENNIPFYVISNSWKFTEKKIKLEQRNRDEIWKEAPQGLKIRNFAFEEIQKKYITKIVSELGIMGYDEFLRRLK